MPILTKNIVIQLLSPFILILKKICLFYFFHAQLVPAFVILQTNLYTSEHFCDSNTDLWKINTRELYCWCQSLTCTPTCWVIQKKFPNAVHTFIILTILFDRLLKKNWLTLTICKAEIAADESSSKRVFVWNEERFGTYHCKTNITMCLK